MASKNQNVFVNIQEVHDVVRLVHLAAAPCRRCKTLILTTSLPAPAPDLPHMRSVCFFEQSDVQPRPPLCKPPTCSAAPRAVVSQMMREGIAKHGGYEINTEGDAFQVCPARSSLVAK